jgi:hypothetical protein
LEKPQRADHEINGEANYPEDNNQIQKINKHKIVTNSVPQLTGLQSPPISVFNRIDNFKRLLQQLFLKKMAPAQK